MRGAVYLNARAPIPMRPIPTNASKATALKCEMHCHAKHSYSPRCISSGSVLLDCHGLVLLDRSAAVLCPYLQVVENSLTGARSKAPGRHIVSKLALLVVFSFSLLGALLDKGVLVRDEPLGRDNPILGFLDDLVFGVLGERYEEGLLRLDGEDAADDGEGRDEVRDESHCCGLGFVVLRERLGVGSIDQGSCVGAVTSVLYGWCRWLKYLGGFRVTGAMFWYVV